MNHNDYWKEAVQVALEDVGITLTDEQLHTVAFNIQCSHENIGLVFGTPENPLSHELAREKEARKKEREQHEIMIRGIEKGVAARRHCDPCDVQISKEGRVTYDGPRW